MDAELLGPGLVMLAGGAAGAWFLKAAWARRTPATWPWLAFGWLALAATLLWPVWLLGAARGPFSAAMLLSVGALALVATGAQIRQARKAAGGRESLAPEPSQRPSTAWRGVLRWLLAGPVGMVAALGVGVCYAVWAPGAVQTRLLVGGLMVPVAWGAAMAWTLADDRILRATAVLVGVAVLGFTAAAIRGLA